VLLVIVMVRSRSRSSPGVDRKSPRHGGSFKESGGNSLKRFGQSIKRIVKEVEEQNSVDETRDVLVNRNVALNLATTHLNKCYLTSLNTVVTLQNEYLESKSVKNILQRYSRLRTMIKAVELAESSWLPLSCLPTQVRTDTVPGYVIRAAEAVLATTQVMEDRRKAEERLIELTSKCVSDENSVLVTDLYRLIKKYQAIRNIVRTLVKDYNESKIYPIIPRYLLLRDMVKDATHHPDYKEYCHEATVEH